MLAYNGLSLQLCMRNNWKLQTFSSRDPTLMRTLWRSLCQPHQDYCGQLWAPTGTLYEIEAQEGPLREFTRKMSVFSGLNYWQRLAKSKLQSRERQTERYRIIYTWKSIQGKVPSLGFNTKWDPRRGTQIVVNRTVGYRDSFKTIREKSIFGIGPKLYNSLPRSIRDIGNNFNHFKFALDSYFSLIPDEPILRGYISHNYDGKCNQTNSIIHWITNLILQDWTIPLYKNSEE